MARHLYKGLKPREKLVGGVGRVGYLVTWICWIQISERIEQGNEE
jgi:hypothetical protein